MAAAAAAEAQKQATESHQVCRYVPRCAACRMDTPPPAFAAARAVVIPFLEILVRAFCRRHQM